METLKTNPKVLVVDDDRCLRELLREILVVEGFKVDQAANGYEACARLGRETYDLILLDLHMPKMDGFSFLQHVSNLEMGSMTTGPAKAIPPVIIVSGFCDEVKTWQSVLRDKVIGVLPKPFSPFKLQRLIKSVLVKAPETCVYVGSNR
ncbi:MAG: response regulator [Planctomycetes bacterium]|nr:response regulator [Planctomycetota bacterium]